jgi:hypothetical protein
MDENGSEGSERMSVIPRWLQLTSAGLAAVAAFLGVPTFTYQLGQDNGSAGAARAIADFDRVQEELANAQTQVAELEEENAKLRSENDRLSRAADSGGAGTEPSSEQLGPSEVSTALPQAVEADDETSPGVFRTTGDEPIVVGAGGDIDIDSLEPDWGVRTSSDQDFGPSTSTNSIGADSRVKFAFVRNRPTFAECEAQTVFDNIVRTEQTVEGQQMCVWSSQGRTAYVRVADIDRENETMSFDIVVWKLPSDP